MTNPKAQTTCGQTHSSETALLSDSPLRHPVTLNYVTEAVIFRACAILYDRGVRRGPRVAMNEAQHIVNLLKT